MQSAVYRDEFIISILDKELINVNIVSIFV